MRIEPTFPASYSEPASFTVSPRIGEPDPHQNHVSREVANMASVASDMLQEVVKEQLDIVANPEYSQEARAAARLKITELVEIVQSASRAVSNVAEAEAAQAQMFTPKGVEEFKETYPGAADSAQDKLAGFLNYKWGEVNNDVADTASSMEKHPELERVLNRRNEEGGVAGFFKRMGVAAVSVAALGSRALAVPALARQAIQRGLDRADDAVQDALDSWHKRFGQAVDGLRQSVVSGIQTAAEATAELASRAAQWGSKQVQDVRDDANKAIETTRNFTQDRLVKPAQEIGHDFKRGAVLTVATADAVLGVASQRFSSAFKNVFYNKVVPAVEGFINDVRRHAEENTPEEFRSRVVNTNFQQAGGYTKEQQELNAQDSVGRSQVAPLEERRRTTINVRFTPEEVQEYFNEPGAARPKGP